MAASDTEYATPLMSPVTTHDRATRSQFELVTAAPDVGCTVKRYPRIAEPPSNEGGRYPTVIIASPPEIDVIFGALETSATMEMVRATGAAAATTASPACEAVMVQVPTDNGLTVPFVSSAQTDEPLDNV